MNGTHDRQAPLTDLFGRVHDYLRISITDHCNLRCTYCMPEDKMDFAPAGKLMTPAEIFRIARAFTDLGVRKIRLTGGEPLVRKEAREILVLLAKLPAELTMTTNATRVHEFIEDLVNAGIRSVNVSLDTFSPAKFNQLTRRNEFDKTFGNIQLLLSKGFHVKLNMVVMKGVNDGELADFVSFTKQHPVHVRFIEFMPFDGNAWHHDRVMSYREMLDRVEASFPVEKLDDERTSTAKAFAVKGHAGTFAFITSVTQPFCEGCNRLRLTADGKMKNCLFSTGEADLLTPLRMGQDINDTIFSCLRSKHARTGGQDLKLPTVNRSMVAIGG